MTPLPLAPPTLEAACAVKRTERYFIGVVPLGTTTPPIVPRAVPQGTPIPPPMMSAGTWWSLGVPFPPLCERGTDAGCRARVV